VRIPSASSTVWYVAAVAAVPDEVGFATKPQQARAMLDRAVAAGVPFGWFTADEAYGQNPGLRGWLEDADIAYAIATRCDDEVVSGLRTSSRVDEVIARVPAGAWRRLSCGDGAHGPRRDDWAWVPIRRPFLHGRRGWVLARRSISDPGEIASYVCFGRHGTRLREHALIPLSSNEIRRLFGSLVLATHTAIEHILHWSQWRRRRQAQARPGPVRPAGGRPARPARLGDRPRWRGAAPCSPRGSDPLDPGRSRCNRAASAAGPRAAPGAGRTASAPRLSPDASSGESSPGG
jgi:hypothetical protein